MKTITLLTGNEKKKMSFAKAFSGKDVLVEMKDIWLPEIQATSNEEVASYAAKYGADILDVPVVKMDSGFYIDALNGFPGPFVRYADRLMGAEYFFPVIENLPVRSCGIQNVLAYCEPGQEPVVFSGGSRGELVHRKPESFDRSFIDTLYIPTHELNPEKHTMGTLRELDYNLFLEMWGDAEERFVEWFLER